jgi:hypothetical protein
MQFSAECELNEEREEKQARKATTVSHDSWRCHGIVISLTK